MPRTLVPVPVPVLTLALALLAACGSTRESVRPAHEGPWIQPSPDFERRIDKHAGRLPYLQSLEDFTTEIRWFVGAGEPAYEILLELAGSDDPKVAGTAFAALGSSGDARLVLHLEEIPWPAEDRSRLRYERARCHTKLGDWSHVDVLIEGLRDGNLWSRSLCFKALRDATGETFDYHPQEEPEAREEAVARWEKWADRREGDELNSAP